MILISLPQPIGRGLGEVMKPLLAEAVEKLCSEGIFDVRYY
jgi:hypothetical protein